jgi:N6-L-threonylcarbamoyladenine synthase
MSQSVIIGIESSCDDSSIAVLSTDGQLLNMMTEAHLDILQPFGGVMPEVVSREHARVLPLLIEQILHGVPLNNIRAIAYTAGPGLPGSLLIGSHCARTLALVSRAAVLPIHHLEGHILAYELEHPAFAYPFLSLIVSGGHTQIVLVKAPFEYQILGKTRDDAAGEAYDKIAKLIGLGYPGGAQLAKLADKGQDRHCLTRPLLSDKKCLDFSFSGLKTQARLVLDSFDGPTEDFCASVQAAINETLQIKVERAITLFPQSKGINLCGGVACNNDLRKRISSVGEKFSLPVAYASPKYCSDNAAMIAISGLKHWQHQGPALHRDFKGGCQSVWSLEA